MNYQADMTPEERKALQAWNKKVLDNEVGQKEAEIETLDQLAKTFGEHGGKAIMQAKLEEGAKGFKPHLIDFWLSQSTMKAFQDYAKGNICGLLMEASITRHVNLYPHTAAMTAGEIFEYWATGQTNYSGEVPDTDILYKENGDLSKLGATVKEQVAMFKKWMRKRGFNRVKTGKRYRKETEDYRASVLPDVVCKRSKKDVSIDLKLSDPNNKFGDFAWHNDTLRYRNNLLIQAKQNYLILGLDYEFYFYVASQRNGHTASSRKIVFKDLEKTVAEHEEELTKVYRSIVFLLENNGFVARPAPDKCMDCPLAKECEKYTDVPILEDYLV